MFEFTQIGWFDPGSKRFCYTDEKEFYSARSSRFQSYTHPVFSIDSETASRLRVSLEPVQQPITKQGSEPAEICPACNGTKGKPHGKLGKWRKCIKCNGTGKHPLA